MGPLCRSMPLCVAPHTIGGVSKLREEGVGNPEISHMLDALFILNFNVVPRLGTELQTLSVPFRLNDPLVLVLGIGLVRNRFYVFDRLRIPPLRSWPSSHRPDTDRWTAVGHNNHMLIRAADVAHPCSFDPTGLQRQLSFWIFMHLDPIRFSHGFGPNLLSKLESHTIEETVVHAVMRSLAVFTHKKSVDQLSRMWNHPL